jgi:hypothetical protein
VWFSTGSDFGVPRDLAGGRFFSPVAFVSITMGTRRMLQVADRGPLESSRPAGTMETRNLYSKGGVKNCHRALEGLCHVLRTGVYIASSPPLGHHHSYIFTPNTHTHSTSTACPGRDNVHCQHSKIPFGESIVPADNLTWHRWEVVPRSDFSFCFLE